MNTLNSIFKTIFVSGAIALASANANAVVINFSGTGWTMDVTINDPILGTYYNKYQDINTARVGYGGSASSPALPWNVAINGVLNPNMLYGTYLLSATTGYELTSLDLQAAGRYFLESDASGSVNLDSIASNYTLSSANRFGFGNWAANAADLNFLSGQLSHFGTFSFLNNAGSGFGASMSGGASTGPEFTIEVSKVPLPGVLALTLTGLLAFGLRRKFSNKA